MKLAPILCATLLAVQPALAQDPAVPLVDEAAQDPAFDTWREKLVEAVAARDTEAVVSMASPSIMLSFGGEEGRDSFGRMLNGQEPFDYPGYYGYGENYWRALETVLALGGRFDGDTRFIAPYTFTADIPEAWEADVFSIFFVIGADKPVFAERSTASEVIATLSETVVLLQEPFQTEPAAGDVFPIRRFDGSTGYMRYEDLRGLVDYRAFFERADGDWQMTIFIAGD